MQCTSGRVRWNPKSLIQTKRLSRFVPSIVITMGTFADTVTFQILNVHECGVLVIVSYICLNFGTCVFMKIPCTIDSDFIVYYEIKYCVWGLVLFRLLFKISRLYFIFSFFLAFGDLFFLTGAGLTNQSNIMQSAPVNKNIHFFFLQKLITLGSLNYLAMWIVPFCEDGRRRCISSYFFQLL